MILYTILVLATGGERIAELIVSSRNAAWSFARGGVEFGRGHFPPMVALHTGLLLACLAEVWFGDRPFIPWLGWPMLVLVLASQALRWWCIAALGPRWNTRVIIVRDLPLVTRGPYRWLKHPNYVAVVVEGFALPLVHTAWITAIAFTVLNAVLLLAVRIPCENKALASVEPARA
ncbi:MULTISPECIES: isoprenylcysteine carboxyl methyltransferase family protein [unclassified Leifsonia]|uniref:isoprenylcysteine carboxyl methyltransferase family protein n=1 Tax=unclassified Leifsonia TaxID=2663824 RepID=UPI001442D75B|nr:isoprenylcysteine carboxyl methyltransferase family protein [Leifsonia sp. PS1209]QIZ97216.1 isoprenylcysteine carboxyl methyltransferase family protein [Leifsonia sp. PS1209]